MIYVFAIIASVYMKVILDLMDSPKLYLTEENKQEAQMRRNKMPKWYREYLERIEKRKGY